MNNGFSRRQVLRGIGACLPLPWLPSLEWASSGEGGTAAPRRFVCLSFGNGADVSHWWAKAGSGGVELGPALAPLAPYREQLTVLQGLRLFDDSRDEGASGHCYYFSNFLSGALVQPGQIHSGRSLDQLLALDVGKHTRVPSLQLGTEPIRTGTIFQAPAICAATMSWRSSTAPVAPLIQPQQVFDRLFDTRSRTADRSVLDLVLGQSRSLRGRLALQDQRKLDEYQESVRELERRLAQIDARQQAGATELVVDMQRPESGIPDSRPEHVRLLMDLLVLALQTDRTRIASFLMCQDVSNFDYRFVDSVSGGLHGLSHSNGASGIAQYQKTNRWHSEQAAYLIERLAGIPEGDGSLLDHTMLLYAATMNDGNKHDPTDLTVILAGGRACDIRPGRLLRFQAEEDRRLCNLHTAIAQRMGITEPDGKPIKRFGNAFHVMEGLS